MDKELIVDVREENEYKSGHAEGSINLPLSKIEKGEISDIKDFSGKVILVCRSGNRAGIALELLKKNGFKGSVVNGGAWSGYAKQNQKDCDYKCESCFMPLGKNLEDAGTETDGSKSTKYCKYCYKEGKLCFEGNDVKEFQRISYENMVKHGMWKPKAWFFSWMIKFAPRWQKK
jgi:rhodanese-related sulfurtransferase